MAQQEREGESESTGEEKRKISRSKARHLRRKRLVAARRAANSGLSLTQSGTEQSSGFQEPDRTLSKSKVRRLRKNKKAELIDDSGETLKTEKLLPDSENSPELLNSRQSPTNNLKYEKADKNLCNLQIDVLDSCDSGDSTLFLPVEKAPSSNPVGTFNGTRRENNRLLTQQTNSGSIVVSNDRNLAKANSKKDTISSDDCVESELLESDEALNKIRTLPHDQNPDFESTCNFRNTNLKSNQSGKNHSGLIKENIVIESHDKKETQNRGGSVRALHRFDSTSNNPITTKNSSFLETDVTPDDDLDCPNSSSSSRSIDQCKINTIQEFDSFGAITKTVKTVLNATELIENEKNLKISSSSFNPRSIFQPNAPVIDLTSYSSSDFINNSDSSSHKLEEQQIIANLIFNSRSDLDENQEFFYSHHPGISNTEPQSKDKNHRELGTENLFNFQNQTSFEIIKDFSSPSTSVNNIASTSSQDSDHCCVSKESEGNMSSVEKTREQVKAEREAKKAAKALAKSKAKAPKSEEKTDAQSSKDTPTKAEQVQNDTKENVVRKVAVPTEKKTVTTETELARSTGNKENEFDSKVDGKTKRENKAERRAKQEAQRALKEKQIAEKSKSKSSVPPKLKDTPKVGDLVKTTVRKTLVDNNLHEVKLFKHLYHERELSLVNVPTLNSNVHPAIVRLGVQYANKVIIGSNARCVALLAAVKQLIEDFERPSQADFTRGLEASLQECAAYLHHCRPMAVSMQNALKHLKWQMTQLPTTVSDDNAKTKLKDAIDTYIREQILLAGKAISNMIQTKISNGDVILTYAFSSLIHNILIDAHNAGKKFRVIVVDGRPWLEGKEQLRRLAKHGIQCSYILINALSFIMPEVSKVFLGAHAILANGAVMSRAGTAQVALMAKAFNVPVLVACETHKSCERVQTDSFVYNEIGDADELAGHSLSKSKKSPLLNWKTKKSLDLLNITFDVTPADLVSAVVTELAILPCTSIPVILRIKPSEI